MINILIEQTKASIEEIDALQNILGLNYDKICQLSSAGISVRLVNAPAPELKALAEKCETPPIQQYPLWLENDIPMPQGFYELCANRYNYKECKKILTDLNAQYEQALSADMLDRADEIKVQIIDFVKRQGRRYYMDTQTASVVIHNILIYSTLFIMAAVFYFNHSIGFLGTCAATLIIVGVIFLYRYTKNRYDIFRYYRKFKDEPLSETVAFELRRKQRGLF